MKNTFNRFRNANLDSKLFILILLGLSIFLMVSYLLSATRLWIGVDAGYYLGVTELIHNGLVPYRDFRLDYTPLVFYLLQIPRFLMGDTPDYTGYMLFLYLFAIVNATLVVLSVKKISQNNRIAYLSGLLFLISYYYLEGTYFILETISLCFGLLSILIIFKKECSLTSYFTSGICCALAFLSKQYGLLFAGCIGIYLLFHKGSWKYKIYRCLYTLSGFLLVIIIFILYYKFSGLETKELIKALSGNSYGNQSISTYIDGIVKSIKLFPFLFLLPCTFIRKNTSDIPIIMTCTIGIVLTTIQFYFNVFPHYYIYMIPFVIILGVMTWKKLKKDNKSQIINLIFYGLVFTSFAMPLQSVYKNTKTLVKHDLREKQDQTTHQLRKIIKDYEIESALCYWNTIPYYATCPLSPSSIKDYGYSFGSDTDETFTKRLKDADCFIINQNEINEITRLKMMSKYLSDNFVPLTETCADGTLVYIRKR